MQEQSYLEYVVDEIQALDVRDGEEEELSAKRKILQQHDKVKNVLHNSSDILEQGNILEGLYSIQRDLESFPMFLLNKNRV